MRMCRGVRVGGKMRMEEEVWVDGRLANVVWGNLKDVRWRGGMTLLVLLALLALAFLGGECFTWVRLESDSDCR